MSRGPEVKRNPQEPAAGWATNPLQCEQTVLSAAVHTFHIYFACMMFDIITNFALSVAAPASVYPAPCTCAMPEWPWGLCWLWW
jgi:hypothetical protein